MEYIVMYHIMGSVLSTASFCYDVTGECISHYEDAKQHFS